MINEKCRAPFHLKAQLNESFHNAFIADVETVLDGEIIVKVFFLNPIENDMKPCQHYLSASCKFPDGSCKYSHGEVVAYTKLKPYHDPNFSLLKRKCHVLVKTETQLWRPGTVIECCKESRTCQVKLQSGSKVFDCSFSDILPPMDADSDSELSSDDDLSDSDCASTSILQIHDNFGEWEKFTTGFGSKMLQKLGYVNGQGLGKSESKELFETRRNFEISILGSDGICQPISAKVYIQGKSLDYNMEQNERKQQETVEEQLKRQSLRQQKISENNYSRKGADGVFNFLNNTICSSKPSTSGTIKKPAEVKTQSKAQLNLSSFKIEEDIKKVKKSLEHLQGSSKRHSGGSAASKSISRQLADKQSELLSLEKQLSDINNEQKMRKDKSKLTIF